MTGPDSSSRTLLAPGDAAGVTEDMVRTLVHAFYDRARRDPEIGPIFEDNVGDWDAHLGKLCDFWSSVTLMTGRFHGMPMQAHARLPGLGPNHFARWLELFAETAEAVCPPAAAALFIDRSRRIARSLQLGIAVTRGDLPALAG